VDYSWIFRSGNGYYNDAVRVSPSRSLYLVRCCNFSCHTVSQNGLFTEAVKVFQEESYGTRYYDRFGRWMQKDPKPLANPYLYANDDPVNNVDLSGRSFNPIACSAAIIALGALAKSFSSFLYNAYLSARAAVAAAIELAATQPELAPLAADLVIAAVLVFAGAVALIAFATYLLLASACNLPGGNISV